MKAGLFTQGEFNLFARCEEFLWRVRCHMHFATGRAEERLTFDLQRSIAERIGYAPRGGLSAVERFMKAYFLIAKDVGDLTAIVCAELEARQTKRRPMLDRMFGRFRRQRGGALVGDDFIVDNNRLNVACDEAFERDPVNLIRLFWLADRHNLAIHPDATRLATRSLRLIGPNLRNDPEANKLFLEIITSRNAPEVVLRRMNETGLLGRFIPDFGRIVAMMQFNMYHHYTVDEHLIRSVGVLTEIEAGQLESEHPLANKIFPTHPQPPRALRRRLPARHRQGPAGGSFDGRCRHRPQARTALRPHRGGNRDGGLARAVSSAHVEHGPEPRSLGSCHHQELRRGGADHGAPEAPARAHHRRHQGGRPRHLDRLEGPAPAQSLPGDGGVSRRRRRRSRPLGAGAHRAGAAARRAARLDATRSSRPMPPATRPATGSRPTRPAGRTRPGCSGKRTGPGTRSGRPTRRISSAG